MEHRFFAAAYDRMMAAAEGRGLHAKRAELLAPLRGCVLEVGAGTGLNVEHYRAVDLLILDEPDAAMRRRLVARLADRPPPFPVRVIGECVGRQTLGLGNSSVDAVVSTLVLCSVDDPGAALREMRRVLRPGGRLVVIEHVRGRGAGAWLQELLTPLQRVVAGGCRLNRRTGALLEASGFSAAGLHSWRLPGSLGILAPAIAGFAVVADSGS